MGVQRKRKGVTIEEMTNDYRGWRAKNNVMYGANPPEMVSGNSVMRFIGKTYLRQTFKVRYRRKKSDKQSLLAEEH